MKVRELMEQLRKFDPNAEVVLCKKDGIFEDLVPLEYCVEHEDEDSGKMQPELVTK